MAKAKYFHVKHKQTGAEHVVRAGRPADAIAAIAGDRTSAVLADQDAITEFYSAGGATHPNSAEPGNGKLFFVPNGEGQALVRAKNAAEAFGKINGSDLYDVALTTADQLVELLDRRVPVVKFEPKGKASATPAGESSDASQSGSTEGAAQPASDGGGEPQAEVESAVAADSEQRIVTAESAQDAPVAAANDEVPADAAA